MEDAHLRMQIHDALERKIHEMEGGARRRRRMPAMHYRAPPGMIYNKHGKLVSYKKHLQGKKLAAKYGFTKHGSKTTKRKTRRKMTGRGDGGHMYGMGYVPELYDKTGPQQKYRYQYCYDDVLGPPAEQGQRTDIFYNPYTGECEEALYGKKLSKAMQEYAKKHVKKVANRGEISDKKAREIAAYQKIYGNLQKGDRYLYPERNIEKLTIKPNYKKILTELLSEKKTPQDITIH
jgi:hypothetical protein